MSAADPVLGDDGYPCQAELERIAAWPYDDHRALLGYVKDRWRYAEDGFFTSDGTTFHLSTAGWSGNQELVGAMMENRFFWATCWVSSRRGGHYVFELPKAPPR